LLACVECEDEGDQELEQLLVAHSLQLADALNTTPPHLEALRTMTPMNRIVRVRTLMRAAKARQQAVHAAAMQNLSIASATMLAKRARWEDDRVHLDPRIVLGRGLVADRTRRYICLAAEGYDSVAIRREKLVGAARALTFPDLSCWLDKRGLLFSWRGGRGQLLLVSQRVESNQRDAVLSVVVDRPRPRAVDVETASHPPRERVSTWVGEAFNELSIF
jgi:hypothetical protein